MITFDDLVGHNRAIATLKAAIERDKVHHAYLLVGAQGIGRFTLAQALAATLLCSARGTTPCGKCPPCHQLNAGSQPDLRLIGADGGAIKVAEVRELTRWASLKPLGGTTRVAILRGAEALSASAANAMLKTLEEPPPGTTFILTTTSLHQTLPTVRSRCQKLPLSPLSPGQVQQVLVGRHGLDPEQAQHLAAVSGGSPGRALGLNDATLELREEVLDTILKAKLRTVLEQQQTAEAHGKDKARIPEAIEAAEVLLRDALVAQCAPRTPLMNSHRADEIIQWSRERSVASMYDRLGALDEARAALNVNVSGRVILERLYQRLSA